MSLIGQTSELAFTFLVDRGLFSSVLESPAQVAPYSGVGPATAVEATEPPFVPEAGL